MKPLQVKVVEMEIAKDLTEEWEELLLRAESVNFRLIEPQFKQQVVQFVHDKHTFWNFMKGKYNLDHYLNYRINANGYLEVERGEGLWLLWEAL